MKVMWGFFIIFGQLIIKWNYDKIKNINFDNCVLVNNCVCHFLFYI